MEHNTQFLEAEPVGRLMHRYAIPCVISLLVGALYNIVDQIFIANASYLGSYGNAANTVVFPLTVVALAIAVMIGDGCCTFVSISLGKGQREDARRAVGNAVVLAAGSGLVLTRCTCCLPIRSWPCSAAPSMPRPSAIRRSISSTSRWASPSICSGRP